MKDLGVEAYLISPIFTSLMVDFGYDVADLLLSTNLTPQKRVDLGALVLEPHEGELFGLSHEV